MAWLIMIGALWTYPIFTFLILYLTKDRENIRKILFLLSFIVPVTVIFGIVFHISTTLSEVDWFAITGIYFSICLALWRTQFQSNKIIKIAGLIGMIAVFGTGYLYGTFGALSAGIVTAKFETDKVKWLENGLIYKERTHGNKISDHRIKKIEIYKTIKWFPVLEWKVQEKTYDNLLIYNTPLSVDYKPAEGKIYLSASMQWGKGHKPYYWYDTISLAAGPSPQMEKGEAPQLLNNH